MCMRSISLLFFAGYGVPCSGLFVPCVQPDLSDRQQHRKLRSDGAAGAAGRHIQQRTWLAVVGFAVWALLIGAYWTFHLDIIPPRITWRWVKQQVLWPYTLDEDATWAVLTHFSGFAIFVLLADSSQRKGLWVLVTALVAISFFWMLRWLRVPTELWALTTNFVGLSVMLVSSVVGLGLFSAVAQLIALLRTLLGEHPQLQKELEGTLEQYPLLKIAVTSFHEAGEPGTLARVPSEPAPHPKSLATLPQLSPVRTAPNATLLRYKDSVVCPPLFLTRGEGGMADKVSEAECTYKRSEGME